MLRISLLHATYMSGVSPSAHRDEWLREARFSERIEYICAMNDTDSWAIERTRDVIRVVNQAPDEFSTAVQNWNSAAALATGDLLVVISDDLFPPRDWDVSLEELAAPHSPLDKDFAIKIQDSPFPDDTTLRHPVVSRRFYERFGLFDDDFRGVYCDNDITLRAFLVSVILDGRDIKFHHAHPHFDRGVDETVSHRKINTPQEYELGSTLFRRKWFPLAWKLNLNRLVLTRQSDHPMPRSFVRRCAFRFLRIVRPQ